jgi:hypothetical protein
MKHFILKPAVALLTFIIGISIAAFWFVQHHSPENIPARVETASRTAIDQHWVYITKNLKWEDAPKELEYPLQYCDNGKLIIFYPSGEFAAVSVSLERRPKSRMMWMLAGNGFSTSKGTWVRNEDGTISTTSRFSGGNKLAKRDGTPPTIVQRWIIREQSSERIANVIESDGVAYAPLEDNFSNFDYLSEMAAADSNW